MDIFLVIALGEVPRILSLIDRDADSPTFGCGDRHYWHYKLIDFPNVRFQEACLLLSLLHENRLADGRYHHNPNVKKWVGGLIDFWFRIQRRNGSFDEVYPYENSFCATSFSTWAVSECMVMMKDVYSHRITKAGEWLMKNQNPQVANQMAAAALALRNVHQLTGQSSFLEGAQKKIDLLLAAQNDDGFFPEYGGCDIGYLSITLSLLALYWRRSEDERLEEPLRRARAFLESSLDENGDFDNSGTSRKTKFIYPLGLKLLGSTAVSALENGLKQNLILNPSWMDDRYVIPFASDYIMTCLEGERN
ncbi:MAG: hypothetical protein JSV16_07325 [Candidatus Hydrogenedentota bacterium]|nr:MAG: hypothetical protein JSV16_07325 [Candidatus Hydrogenedentota bacterium]